MVHQLTDVVVLLFFFLTQHILNTVNKLMSTYLTPMSKCKPTHDHSAATVFEQQISSVSVDLKLDLNEAAIKKHLCYKITFYWLLLFFTLKYLRERCAFFSINAWFNAWLNRELLAWMCFYDMMTFSLTMTEEPSNHTFMSYKVHKYTA